MEKLQKKYGFWTATAMVVGIVIGSGVFFKADDVLIASGGSLPIALVAWLIGGLIMIITSFVFAKIATRYERVNGLVDYFEEAYGPKGGYLVGWFMTFVYYPTLCAVLAWVSANYTMGLFALESGIWLIAFIYLTLFFLLNVLSPVLAGRWQVSTAMIKLVPIAIVVVIGLVMGLTKGQTIASFTNSAQNISSSGGGLAVATLATVFAYEGWIIATSINAELRDAKKTLPKALMVGAAVVVIAYMLYYIGIAGVLTNDQVIAAADNAPVQVISLVFGNLAGTILTLFVVVSCLGTLNGLVMGSVRGMYSIAARKLGPKPEIFGKVNEKTNSTINSGILGFILSAIWLVVWYGNFHGWWGFMDISELPIAFLYLIYLSLYLWVMRSFTDETVFVRFIAPALAAVGSCYIIWGAIQKAMIIPFVVITLLIFLAGILMRGNKNSL